MPLNVYLYCKTFWLRNNTMKSVTLVLKKHASFTTFGKAPRNFLSPVSHARAVSGRKVI